MEGTYGALYREKPNSKQKRVSILVPNDKRNSIIPKAYVEDAPEEHEYRETSTSLLEDNTEYRPSAVPRAPTPPSAIPEEAPPAFNVFDFLVTDDSPNASRVSLVAPPAREEEQMQMVVDAPPIFKEIVPRSERRQEYETSSESEEEPNDVYSYQDTPAITIEPKQSRRESYQTPAPKPRNTETKRNSMVYELDAGPATTRKSTDKKRKRQVEELDLTVARHTSQELDEMMEDGDAHPSLHTGLTGGLNRLLSRSTKFPPSPEYSGGDANEDVASLLSPVKRTRAIDNKPHNREVNGATADRNKPSKERGRTTHSAALVRVRKVRKGSDESRPRKHQRSQRHSSVEDRPHHISASHKDRHHSSERQHSKVKAIEYHPTQQSSKDDPSSQLVLYQSRAELLMSFVTKGPDSTNGCSMNKALKRYHRERGEVGPKEKGEEEKMLWKSLRLKRNERGEVVVMF
ncbi:hypothetical protein MMC25_001243 [Agyrium rufum]|nr:hypothetical protein [Agyrium rufum]